MRDPKTSTATPQTTVENTVSAPVDPVDEFLGGMEDDDMPF